jgi:hypothetical protein
MRVNSLSVGNLRIYPKARLLQKPANPLALQILAQSRFFHTAQDRLVKQLRLAGACTLEAANACLDSQFLPDWEERFTVPPANPTDAHRTLTELHNLAATLSCVETRTIAADYTVQFEGKRYQIARSSVRVGMKGQKVRVEARLDGSIAMRLKAPT